MLQICWEGIFQGLWLTSLKTFIVANIVSSLRTTWRRSLYTWWNSLNIVTAQFFFFFFSFYFSRIVISIGAILIAYVSTKRKWSKILFMLTDAVSIACVAGGLRFRVSGRKMKGLSFSSPPPKPRAASNVSYCKHLFLCLLLVLLYIWSIDWFT